MKRLFLSILMSHIYAAVMFAGDTYKASFSIDATRLGKVVGNKVSTVNVWDFHTWNPVSKHEGADLTKFVETIQFMQATGGNAQRDLFINPADSTVLDDYDFSPLLQACRRALAYHAKPLVKLSVPDKFSKGRMVGMFKVDVLPPDDYEVYYNYIKAMAEQLVAEFGKEEVLTWGWGVLVEFENADWFHDKAKSPEGTRDAYLRLYDYSYAALSSVLGDDIYIGAHAMACTEGLWDERDLLTHCVNDLNAKTGKKGTPIRYFAVSYYDDGLDLPHHTTLAQTIDHIRQRAVELGLTDLVYGIDEGRIIGATKGRIMSALRWRVVGNTYQVAYDARLFKIMVDNDIDYFSAWSYSTSNPYEGYPLLCYRVAEELYDRRNDRRVESVATARQLPDSVDCDVVASYNAEKEQLHVIAYNFKFDLNYDQSVETEITCDVPFWKGMRIRLVEKVIDDRCNFFCTWLKDKERYGFSDEIFDWCPLGGAFDVDIQDAAARKVYLERLRPKYVKIANTPPAKRIRTVKVGSDGKVRFKVRLQHHAAAFYTLSPSSSL